MATWLALAASGALAQGVASEAQLLVVTGQRAALDPQLPVSSASVTAEDLREQNLFNAEDAARLLPSTTVRKRFLGDRNANVGGRSFGVLQPGRALVYVDGYLISSFLGRFDAPRWNMINLEAIERVDAMYGPFSAIYPGNSIGTTLAVSERKPRGFEASASLRLAAQHFREYLADERLASGQASARLAMRHDGGAFWALGVQHQDSQGQPMGYAGAVRGVTPGAFSAPGAQTTVDGIVRDRDPQSRERALFGATGLDQARQDTLSLRAGTPVGDQQEIEARLALWRSDSTTRGDSWLRDASGATIWSGPVRDGLEAFDVPASTFAPARRTEHHRQLGATWKTRHAHGWNASVVATQYRILDDASHQADLAPPAAALGGSGSVTRRDGTGWNTFEVQATWTPAPAGGDGSRHALTAGLHRNEYVLDQGVETLADWRQGRGTPSQHYTGRTRVTAIYAQDAWRFAEDWRLTGGVRVERFETFDGRQSFSGPLPVQADYPARTISATSPKLSLSWAASEALLLRASAGRGVRFPNVDELYNGTRTASGITTSDPDLKPERSDALELSAEVELGRGSLRASLFRDDIADSIVRQTDATVTPSVTRISNVDRVVTRGLELVWDLRDLGLKGLDLSGSATFADARIRANAASPATVGKRWLRIPPQRYVAQAAWRVDPAWLLSAAWRRSGRQFNTDTNVDDHPDVYGGVSRLRQLDLKAAWRFAPQWEWSLGVDNASGAAAWQVHSLPQRTWHTALRWEERR